MTTIAWDGKTLAADRQSTYGSLIRTACKIHRVDDALVALAGEAWQCEEMLNWYENGASPETFPASNRDKDEWAQMIVIRRDDAGEARIFSYERSPHPIKRFDETIAIGSGRDFALTAMYLGKTAFQAVNIACMFDAFSGNGVDVLTL